MPGSKSVRWLFGLTALILLGVPITSAPQQSKPAAVGPAPSPTELASEQDHQRLMDLLHIKTIRPGADPNHPDAPNAVNYDESKANPFPTLPDPLVMKNGEKVTTAEMWWNKRCPEIVEDFDREVYGRLPTEIPRVHWQVTSQKKDSVGGLSVVTKKLVGHVDNSAFPSVTVDIQATLVTPVTATGSVPVFIELAFDPVLMRKLFERLAARGVKLPPPPPGPSWQQQVLAKDWGYAELLTTSVQADNGDGLTAGIIGLSNHGLPRKLDDWGALKAWAWGASRLLDYFETDKSVNARQVGVMGHSRFGKAALVAMAYDQRFAIGFISSSGMGGANLYRRNFGERLENLAGTGEYHWMAGNYIKYAGPLTPNDLPVDSHELIALCAPRPVFIGSGADKGDAWVDSKGMFMAEAAAGPVYELLGKKGLGTGQMPPVGRALLDGELAFREHSDGHTPAPNWPAFLTFAAQYLHAPSPRK